MRDPHDLGRFLAAQEPLLPQVRQELSEGHKRSHWMWFIFPQIAGLGSSGMAQRYAIQSLAEARAYMAHPILGPRLRELTALANNAQSHSAHAIFGSPDDMKFHACATLFARAAPEAPEFRAALDKYFSGEPHPGTMERLSKEA